MWPFAPTSERFFSDEERRQIEGLFEAIVPGDDTAPGATDAGAAEYLSHLLAMPESTYYEINAWRELYRDGLPALATASAAQFQGRSLSGLSQDELTDLVSQLSQGTLAPMPDTIDQKRLFATLRNHCIEGCFADPRWGGNRDRIIWRWYGYLETAKPFRRGSSGALEEVPCE